MPARNLGDAVNSQRDRTRALQSVLAQSTQVSSREALDALDTEWELFSTRLIRYVADNSPFFIEGDDAEAAVRAALREGAKLRGFSFSGGDYFNRWLKDDKYRLVRKSKAKAGVSECEKANAKVYRVIKNWQCYLDKETIFKLCLCLQLDIEAARGFVYDCLFLDWFDLRDGEDAIYMFVISQQSLFGEESFSVAKRLRDARGGRRRHVREADGSDFTGATTAVLGAAFSELVEMDYAGDKGRAESDIERFLSDYSAFFTQIKRTAVSRYNEYLVGSGRNVNFDSLKILYERSVAEKDPFPASSYLEMCNSDTGPCEYEENRLLWGSRGREEWCAARRGERERAVEEAARTGKTVYVPEEQEDILNGRVIALDHGQVGSFLKLENKKECVQDRSSGGLSAPPRGNILMLYFLHFCYANNEEFQSRDPGVQGELCERFIEQANYVLDDCGMMPLHPRRPLDALILRSVANIPNEDDLAPYHPEQPVPVRFLNTMLMRYYATGGVQ